VKRDVDLKALNPSPMPEPKKEGVVTWHRHRFTSRESLIYRVKSSE
jgi:hypothetical protein